MCRNSFVKAEINLKILVSHRTGSKHAMKCNRKRTALFLDLRGDDNISTVNKLADSNLNHTFDRKLTGFYQGFINPSHTVSPYHLEAPTHTHCLSLPSRSLPTHCLSLPSRSSYTHCLSLPARSSYTHVSPYHPEAPTHTVSPYHLEAPPILTI